MQFQRKLIFYINFIKDLNFIPVILAPFLLSLGLSLSDLMLVLSAFRLTQMSLAIPMGFLSDYYGPVFTLRMASIFVLLSIGCLIPSDLGLINFLMFNIFSAISVTLLGASSSKLLKAIEPNGEQFLKNLSWTLSLRRLGIMLSGLIASGLLLVFKYDPIVYFQLFLAVGLLLISFKVDYALNTRPNPEKLYKHLQQGLRQAPWMAIWSTAVVGATFFITFDIFLQPLMVQAQVPKALFPFILAFANLAIFFSLNYAHKIQKYLHFNYYSSTLIPLLPLIIYSLLDSPVLALVAMVITILMRPVAVKETVKLVNSNPVHNQGINDALVNTFSTGITAFYSLLLGYCLKFYSLKMSTSIVLVILISCCLVFFIIKYKVEHYSLELKTKENT